MGATTFADPGFLTKLDVAFANLFFAALSAFEVGSPDTPHAWSPLFEARSSSVIAPIQFALAGMNAHINRDLPVALVDIFTAAGLAPSEESAEYADFERVNALLATTEKQVKDLYLDGLMRQLDAKFDGGRRRGSDLERRRRTSGGLDQRRGAVAPARHRPDRAHLPGDAGSHRRVRLARASSSLYGEALARRAFPRSYFQFLRPKPAIPEPVGQPDRGNRGRSIGDLPKRTGAGATD